MDLPSESRDLLLIPVLMSEVPLRSIGDEEAAKIAAVIRRMLPPMDGARVVIVPALYYLSDILGRMKLDEILVNSAALVEMMERRGLRSDVYVFNPYSSNGMIPAPNRLGGGTGGLTWAIIPIIVLGGDAPLSYDDEELEYLLDDLESLLSRVYGTLNLRIFPPITIENLLDLIDSVEEIYEESWDSWASAG